MGVDGLGIANTAPDESFPEDGLPRLTVQMVARLQSFPDDWEFTGTKTAAYRQVGNAFPPQVARAVGLAIRRALNRERAPTNGESYAFEPRLLEHHKERNRTWKAKKVPSN
jgi:DNA (cytosine-5)-methyltransferase 1